MANDTKTSERPNNPAPDDATLIPISTDTGGGTYQSDNTTKAQLLADQQAQTDAQQTEIDTNTAKVSADGSVTTHSDVTDAGSGQIIASSERSAIGANTANNTGPVTVHSDMTDAGSGAVITTAERNKLAALLPGATDNLGTLHDVEKDSSSVSLDRAKLDFRDTGDATVTVTDDPANDRTIISIDATAGAGGSGDVVGPASAVDSNFAEYDGVTGKLIKDGGASSSDFATAAQGATADTALQPNDNISELANDVGYITAVQDDFAPVLAGDLNRSGHHDFETYTAAAGNTFAVGNVGILNAAGQVVLGDNTTEAGVAGHAVMAAEAVAGGALGKFVEDGDLKGLAGLTAGATYFFGTAGGITETPPASSNFMRVVGAARTAGIFNFNPSSDYFTVV